jgi:hypothetical protein
MHVIPLHDPGKSYSILYNIENSEDLTVMAG